MIDEPAAEKYIQTVKIESRGDGSGIVFVESVSAAMVGAEFYEFCVVTIASQSIFYFFVTGTQPSGPSPQLLPAN